MEKLNITAVIIAKNEERRIRRCLESLKWADEVIVVDGDSSDRTAQIAESFAARIIRHPFTGSFADDRNAGMEAARNDWVLQLDADEVVTDDFVRKAKDALSGSREGVAVYKFRRRNFFLGHSMDHGGFHHYIPNLVNKKLVRFGGSVHEVPVHDGKEGVIEADIEHYPFDSVSQFIDRQNRYTDIAARQLLKDYGLLPEGRIRANMIGRSFKVFWKSYIRKGGYRDGFYGFLFASLFSLINFMKWAKYWEMANDKKPETSNQKPEKKDFPSFSFLVSVLWFLVS